MATLSEYITANRQQKVSAEILSRWQSRVLPRELHLQGVAGAQQYLADYGRGIAAPKCIQLACQAEQEGYGEMALGFWAKAYELATKQSLDWSQLTTTTTATNQKTITPVVTPAASPRNQFNSQFPAALQPGRLLTMQPVDAPRPQIDYINDDAYLGQPKRDGNRLVVLAEQGQVFYQSRSTKLRSQPDLTLHQIFKVAEQTLGAFILDGELVYFDCQGGEHRTGAQAASVNIELGQPTTPPTVRYCIFDLLYWHKDLTALPKKERLALATQFCQWLLTQNQSLFEMIPSYWTTAEKQALVAQQKAEGREGEVWHHKDAPYTSGKNQITFPAVRTKYLVELDVLLLNLTPTTAAGRLFGALEVAKVVDGQIIPLGSVGTGYTLEEMKDIYDRHQAHPGEVWLEIACQGFTEAGKIWHGRYRGFSKQEEN